MIRESFRLEKVITAITDVLVIFVSYILAVYIRYYIMYADPGLDLLSAPYLWIAAAYSLIMAGVMTYRRRKQEVEQGDRAGIGIVTVNAFGCLGFLAFLYTIGEIYFSRWAMVLFWIFSSVLLLVKEMILDAVFDRRMRVLTRKKRVLVVGEGELAFEYLRSVGFDAACDFTIIGYVGGRSSFFFENAFESDGKRYGLAAEEGAADGKPDVTRRGWLGGYDAFADIAEKTQPDEVVFALESGEMHRFPELLTIARERHIAASMMTGFSKYIPKNAAVRAVDDAKLIDLSAEGPAAGKNDGLEKLGMALSAAFLLVIFVLHMYGIGSEESLRMYDSFRYLLFGALSACLFLSLKWPAPGRKSRQLIRAAVTIALCSVLAWIYECVYTAGAHTAEYFLSDFKMVLLFVVVCCAAKIAGEFIEKDDAFLYF